MYTGECDDRVAALEAEIGRLQRMLLELPDLRRKSEAEAERMWLQLGDKESFACEAKAKSKLWHDELEKNKRLVSLLLRCADFLGGKPDVKAALLWNEIHIEIKDEDL